MRLKELRLRTNYNQTQLAQILNIPRINYNKYELGQNRPDLETLIKIADFYNVSLDYLCERQYNNQIGYVPDEKRETVNELLSLDNKEFEKAQVYIKALKDMNN